MAASPPFPRLDAEHTRERLLAAMAQQLQCCGLNGQGLSELLAQARAPKGVLYHHFPGGKTELALAALEAMMDWLLQLLECFMAREAHPSGVLRAWMLQASRVLEKSQFERGCPLAVVALESGPQDLALRQALSRGFERLRDRLARHLHEAGLPQARAHGHAALIVAAYEGALIQARVAGHSQPLVDCTETLADLIERELAP